MATQTRDTYSFHTRYVQELEKGNPAVANHFVAYFRPRLQSLLRKTGVPADFLEDLQQETFMRVLTALRTKSLRHPERLGSFVNAVCKNALFELFRSRKRHVEIDDTMLTDLPAKALPPEAIFLEKEASTLIGKVLSRLPPREQKLLRSLVFGEGSKAGICEELGVSRAHLRMLLYRAKRKFVSRMAGHELRHLQDICNGTFKQTRDRSRPGTWDRGSSPEAFISPIR
jgi:RNA polymerase sigma factor (sigma-70 family)